MGQVSATGAALRSKASTVPCSVGSKLTFRGLPCPNIFTGGHNFHSKLEFNSRRGLEKTTETLVHLVELIGASTQRASGRS
jgi:hypothetical protein